MGLLRLHPSKPTGSFRPGFLGKAAQLASGHAVGYLLTLGAAPLLARLYGPAAFGIFAVFVTAASCLTVVATCRFEQAIPLSKTRRAAADTALLACLSTVVATLLLALLCGVLHPALAAAASRELPPLLAPLLAVAVASLAVYQITTSWLLRLGFYRDLATMRVVYAAASVALQVLIPLAGGAVLLGLAAGQSIGFAAGALYGCIRTRNTWPAVRLDRVKRVWHRVSLHRRFAYYGVPAALAGNLSVHGPVVLLAALYGVEAAGIYALAQRVFTTPLTLLTNAFSRVYYVEATQCANRDALQNLFRFTFSRVLAFAAIPVFFVACIAPWTFGWLFGAEWHSAGVVCALLAPAVLAMTLAYVIGPTFDVLDKQVYKLGGEIAVAVAIALGMTAAWLAGASVYTAIGLAAAGGTAGYCLQLLIAYRCVLQTEAHSTRHPLKRAA